MGYNIKQKIEICLKAEANTSMTQADLATWAKNTYGSVKSPSQTTISRILSCKDDLISSKSTEFNLVRRRKKSNPLLRRVLAEFTAQCLWEKIPITTPIIQSTAHSIWNQLPKTEKEGKGEFNHKWCNSFMKLLNINLDKDPLDPHMNRVWALEDIVELQSYLRMLIHTYNYSPKDIFTIDEFQLFYSLPLDQIFDVSSINKGLKQSDSPTERSLTIMLGCNIDGSEKLDPLVVGKFDKIDLTQSTNSHFASSASTSTSSSHFSHKTLSNQATRNKILENFKVHYKSNINKWVTSSMFHRYLLTLDHKLQSSDPSRKILIIVDDTSTHRILNLKFSNIRLCYLKNNTKNKNPYNSSFTSVKFDYLPMNFGIIEEFRILFRVRQYLAMINLQRLNSKTTSIYDKVSNQYDLSKLNHNANTAMEVLSETDYRIPLINVLEWIRLVWDSVSPTKILDAWKSTRLINFNQAWPASDPNISYEANQTIQSLYNNMVRYNPKHNYEKLERVITYLNVVIPWEIDELIGVVNERCKVTLTYVSLEEIIDSCILESFDYDESHFSNLTKYEPDWHREGLHSSSLPEHIEKAERFKEPSLPLQTSDMQIDNAPFKLLEEIYTIAEEEIDNMEWIPEAKDQGASDHWDSREYSINTGWFPEKRKETEAPEWVPEKRRIVDPNYGIQFTPPSMNHTSFTDSVQHQLDSQLHSLRSIPNNQSIIQAIQTLVHADEQKQVKLSYETVSELNIKLSQLQDLVYPKTYQ